MAPTGKNRHPSWSLLGSATLLIALTGCSVSPAGSAPCPAVTVASPAETALLPAGLSFDRIGPITHVVSTAGHITVQAFSTKPIDELTVLIQDAVTAAGYRPAGMDNEGFEAEVFFTAGQYAAGQALIRRSDCEGRWAIELVLIDSTAVPTTSR